MNKEVLEKNKKKIYIFFLIVIFSFIYCNYNIVKEQRKEEMKKINNVYTAILPTQSDKYIPITSNTDLEKVLSVPLY